MRRRRCPGCGELFAGDECPNQHGESFIPLGPLDRGSLAGILAYYDWPGSGRVFGMVTDEPDSDGNVGFAVVHPNTRVAYEDLEEI